MSWDPEINRQDAIEALWAEAAAATQERRVMNSRLGLAGALEAIERERTAGRPDPTPPFTISDCIAHLRVTASPQREQP